MTDSKILKKLEKKENLEKKTIHEIFGAQKVKLYKIKHFMFDFGGVMVERSFAFKNFLDIIKHDHIIKKEFQNDHKFKEQRKKLSAGVINARELLEFIFEEYYYPYQKIEGSLPPKKINIDYYLELWFQLYSRFVHLSSEMEEIVTRLHKAGYIVSLISNTFDIHAKCNELKGFYKIFDHVFLSNEIGLIKPDKNKYLHVLENLDAKPKSCFFIDDKPRNLITARELGIIVIKFESIKKFKKQLSELGIEEISENLREEIQNKYKQYEQKKNEYKKAKKEYKKVKKKKNTFSGKIHHKIKKKKYEEKKIEYKEMKEKKKRDLERKFTLT
ncbi:MAG: HAD-IA family hydrolase [Promethearchaeota archaeon]